MELNAESVRPPDASADASTTRPDRIDAGPASDAGSVSTGSDASDRDAAQMPVTDAGEIDAAAIDQENERGFAERAAQVLGYYRNRDPSRYHPKWTFLYAEAHFALGDDAGGRRLVNRAFDLMDSDDPSFQLWGAMDSLLRFGDRFDDATRARAREILTDTPEYEFAANNMTENKKVMTATARFLAQETWPTDSFESNCAPNDPDGKNALLDRMQVTVRNGMREHNSPTYFALHFGSYLTLAEFAKDPDVRQRAQVTCEWLLTAAAPAWMNGWWAAPTERVYSYFRGQSDYRSGDGLAWLYFDGPDPASLSHGTEMFDVIPMAISSWRPPRQVIAIARDRTVPYTHEATQGATAFGDTIFYGQTFVAGRYAVYSQHEAPIGTRRPNQMQRWAVVWESPARKSILFLQNPHGSKVDNFGATANEQVLQDEGTVIGVFDIPTTPANWTQGDATDYLTHVNGWIPNDHAAIINKAASDGYLILSYGHVLIYVRLSRPFTFGSGDESFRVDHRKLGFAVEAVDAEAYSGLTPEQQCAALERDIAGRTSFDASHIEESMPVLTYRNLDGKTLSVAFRGPDTIDGVAVDYSITARPLLGGSPWVQQAYEGDQLRVRHGQRERTYDFNSWTVSERPVGAR